MLYYENNEWKISKHKVIYTDNGEQLENYVGIGDKQWWDDLAKQHKDINIVEFVEITTTDEQLERLDVINQLNISDGHGAVVSDYVLEGKFPDEASHVLKDLETNLLKLENKQLKQQVVSQTKVADFQEELIAELAFKVYK